MTRDEMNLAEKLIKDRRGRIIYTYRGSIEKGIGGRYVWRAGYSATTKEAPYFPGDLEHYGVLYPWMEKRECVKDAQRFGCEAVFAEDRAPL